MIDYNGEEFQSLIASRKKQHLTQQQKEENIIEYCTFFRRSWDIFIEEFLEIPLFPYQRNMLLEIQDGEVVTLICSRGSSKSFCTAIAAVTACLLRSNYNVIVVSLTLAQSNLLISSKIDKELSNEKTGISPVLRQLRKDGWMEFKKDQNTGGLIVEFGNGSTLRSFALAESLRGNLGQMVILDEAAICSKTLYQSVAEPCLTQRVWSGKPVGYVEPTPQILLSSARSRTNWLWRFLVNTVNGYYNKNSKTKYGFMCVDVLSATIAGIQSPNQYYQRKKNTDDLTFSQEYMNIFLGENENSLFKMEDFEKNQVLENAFQPRTLDEILDRIENKYNFSNDEWIRIVACDIAISGGAEDDASAFILMSINKNSGERNVEYVTSLRGSNAVNQVIEIKRLFYEYQAHYCVIDTKGVGATLYDLFTVPTQDAEYGKLYPAWTVSRDKALQIVSDTVQSDKITRTITEDAEEVIIPITGSAELNSQGHLALRKALKDGYINLLKDDAEIQPIIEERDPVFVTRSSEEKARILMPYLQTRALVNEAVSLEMKITETGLVKLQEATRTNTKDLYMALNYANLLADKIQLKYQKDNEPDWTVDDWAWLAG
jgi:hypothetical protein